MDTLITANLLQQTPSERRNDEWAEDEYYRAHAPRRPWKAARLASLGAVLVSLLAVTVDRLM
jgi:hypothetical protein